MPFDIDMTVFGQDHQDRMGTECNCTGTDKGCLLQDAEYYSDFGEPEYRNLESSARRVVARIKREGFAVNTEMGN